MRKISVPLTEAMMVFVNTHRGHLSIEEFVKRLIEIGCLREAANQAEAKCREKTDELLREIDASAPTKLH